MKKVIFFLLLSAAVSCNTAEDKTTSSNESEKASSNSDVTYASPVTYSSDFEMGNTKHSQTVIQLWKEFDANNLDAVKDAFADTVVMEFPGMRTRLNRDSMMNMTKQYRAQYSSISNEVEAVLPTRAKNRNEDWVAIWGMETSTKGGKTDSTRIHEIWRFNKDGKIDYMAQFIQPQSPMQ